MSTQSQQAAHRYWTTFRSLPQWPTSGVVGPQFLVRSQHWVHGCNSLIFLRTIARGPQTREESTPRKSYALFGILVSDFPDAPSHSSMNHRLRREYMQPGVPSGFGRKCTSAAGNALLGKDEAFPRNSNQDAVHARTM
jgi:hypothetical protein